MKAQEDADARAKAAKERLEAAKRAEDEKARAERAQAEAKAKKETKLKLKPKLKPKQKPKRKSAKEVKGLQTGEQREKPNFYHTNKKLQRLNRKSLLLSSSSKEFKTVCFNGKRRIKPKVGQLTDSVDQLNKILLELDELFS